MVRGWNAILYYKVSARSLYYTRKSVSFKKIILQQKLICQKLYRYSTVILSIVVKEITRKIVNKYSLYGYPDKCSQALHLFNFKLNKELYIVWVKFGPFQNSTFDISFY